MRRTNGKSSGRVIEALESFEGAPQPVVPNHLRDRDARQPRPQPQRFGEKAHPAIAPRILLGPASALPTIRRLSDPRSYHRRRHRPLSGVSSGVGDS